ncbi:MAG: hypothetical protein K9J27_09450 [Bacteroidales bacterium]|nr:hypothetical protein [Bacteroidales bacterium]MCF8333919.1 hypothetical protein [Bacteroidales bacterium]
MKNKLLVFLLILGVATSCSDEKNPSPDNGDDGNGDNEVQNYHKNPVGYSANDLLASDEFTQLQIEIIYVKDYAPTDESIQNLKSFMQERLNKPDGISISTTAIELPGLAPYSTNDIIQIESNHRSAFNSDNTLTVYGFIADRQFEQNENVLGVAYRNTSFALFGSKIEENSGGLNQPSKALLESTVMNHELSHLLGLVNNGTPMQNDHQDEEHGHHCDNEDCLMYWTAETGDIVSTLVGMDNPPPLYENCINDLQANGGGSMAIQE